MIRIAILAALPEEYNPFQKKTSPWKLVERKPFKLFSRSLPEKEIFLIETGMGKQPLHKAMRWALEKRAADLILSVGFAGSLSKDLHVGHVLWGQRLLSWESPSLSEETGSFTLTPSQALSRFCRDQNVQKAQIVTLARPEGKSFLSQAFPDTSCVIDMESYFTAQFAFEKQVPLLCFRAVSDALEDEIDFDLHEITGPDGRVQIPKVLRVVYRKPHLMRSFYASWQRSRKAADQLGSMLTSFIRLPVTVLEEIASESQLRSIVGKKKSCP